MVSRAVNQWTASSTYRCSLAIDNNRAENQLRVVAVGRKNWLFAGSMVGAHRAALLYSLVQSCKLVDVPPFDYLKDVLLRVATLLALTLIRNPSDRSARILPVTK